MLVAEKIKKNILGSVKMARIYNKLNPILFDVSLRDGIQGMKPEEMSYDKKIHEFCRINRVMNPQKIEVGSIVSEKLLPILKDSDRLYKECIQIAENLNPNEELGKSAEKIYINTPELYLLIPPSFNKFKKIQELECNSISIMSTVSNAFMKKNTNTNIKTTKRKINEIFSNEELKNKKIYLSCIDECPIDGKIPVINIINTIQYYSKISTEICLSDTCGSLSFKTYKEIIDECLSKGISSNLISLHLHIKNEEEVEKIIRYSFEKNINKFDVSAIENGGCSVTLKDNQMSKNLSYDLFYEILHRYISDLDDDPLSASPIDTSLKKPKITKKIPMIEGSFDYFEKDILAFA
jgi:hypothetical protein